MEFASKLGAAFLLAAAMCASATYADGVCVKGYRDTTAAERQTMLTVMETAKAALPVAPPGWVIGGYEELSPVGSIWRAEGGVESQRRGTHSSSAAHAVAVTVAADPARLDSLLTSIDFGEIAATVAR
jgi:hypothetical protein